MHRIARGDPAFSSGGEMKSRVWLAAGLAALLGVVCAPAAQAGSVRFFGNGVNDIDRIKIRIDDPSSSNDPGPPADVGLDFTIEFWIKGSLADNNIGGRRCGNVYGWIDGHTIFDRDRYDQPRAFGISVDSQGRIAFGANVANNIWTICGSRNVLDGDWHHVAVTRGSNGTMGLFVDGVLDESTTSGPTGDISYPDNGVPLNQCGGPCTNSDPFIVLGAEKHDANRFSAPSFNGFLDELRISTEIRYTGSFTRPTQPFTVDGTTAALYHFDEASGTAVNDVRGLSNGFMKVGGSPSGPQWSTDSPFSSSGPGTLQFQSSAASVSENAGSAVLTVTRTGGSDGAVSVNYATANGTALAGSDYTSSTGTLQWNAGDAAPKTLSVPISQDTEVEGDETFSVTLSAPTGGATVGSPATATVTILDNPPAGLLQFQSATFQVTEGAPSAAITVVRVNGSGGAVSVNYATAGAGSTATAGSDYAASSGTLSWATGASGARQFAIPIIDDAVAEPAETVQIQLSNPTGGAQLGTPSEATLTIADDDPPPGTGQLQFSSATYSVAEDGGSASITVRRVNGSGGPASVSYATSNGTATAPADYATASGMLSWLAGDAADKSFQVAIVDDAVVESAETLTVQLSGATGASLGTPTAATVTITDNDVPPQPGVLQLAQASYTVAENAGPVTVAVNRTGGTDGGVSVQLSAANGSAVSGSDYNFAGTTLTWAAGDASPKTTSISIVNDSVSEPTESFTVSLSSPGGGATLGTPATSTITITDDDSPGAGGGGGGGGGGAVGWHWLCAGLLLLARREARTRLLRV